MTTLTNAVSTTATQLQRTVPQVRHRAVDIGIFCRWIGGWIGGWISHSDATMQQMIPFHSVD